MARTWASCSATGERATNECVVPSGGSCAVVGAAGLRGLRLDALDRREFAFGNRG
jgi:hypothetical protein